MQWLAEICVKRPVLATVLSLVIVVVGSVFYQQLGVDQFPKIDLPLVMIVTRPSAVSTGLFRAAPIFAFPVASPNMARAVSPVHAIPIGL